MSMWKTDAGCGLWGLPLSKQAAAFFASQASCAVSNVGCTVEAESGMVVTKCYVGRGLWIRGKHSAEWSQSNPQPGTLCPNNPDVQPESNLFKEQWACLQDKGSTHAPLYFLVLYSSATNLGLCEFGHAQALLTTRHLSHRRHQINVPLSSLHQTIGILWVDRKGRKTWHVGVLE